MLELPVLGETTIANSQGNFSHNIIRGFCNFAIMWQSLLKILSQKIFPHLRKFEYLPSICAVVVVVAVENSKSNSSINA